MRTNVQNERAIRIGSGVIRKGGVNLGLFDKGTLELSVNTLQVRASNGHLPPRQKVESVKFSAELYEIDLNNFHKYLSSGETTKRTGATENITGEVLQKTGEVKTGKKFTLAKSNSVKATAITVKHKGQTIPESDYEIKVEDYRTVIVYKKSTPLTLTGDLTADYTIMTNDGIVYTIRDIISSIATEDLTFEQVDERGKAFKITIPKGYNSENMKLEIGHNDKLDEVMKLPITIEAFPDEAGRLAIIEDEQAV